MTAGMGDEIGAPIGGGADDVVAALTAREDLRSAPLAEHDKPLQFVDSVLRYAQVWLSANQAISDGPGGFAAFVYSERPRQDPQLMTGAQFVRGFRKAYDHSLSGVVHLATAGADYVYRTQSGASSLHEMLEALANYQLGDRPTVVLDLSNLCALYYPAGADEEETVTEYSVRAGTAVVNAQSVDEFLSRFYDIYLRVPTKGLEFWSHEYYYVPRSDIEDAIQNQLKLAARLHFEGCITQGEVDTEEGRADVSIAPEYGRAGEPVVLELKVLRAKYHHEKPKLATSCSEAVNQKWAADGIDQADRYRRRMKAVHAFTCCYDMRKTDDDSIITALQADADRLQVLLRRYFMYNSAKAARRASPTSAFAALTKRSSRRRKADK
jgi:hypothetical protein